MAYVSNPWLRAMSEAHKVSLFLLALFEAYCDPKRRIRKRPKDSWLPPVGWNGRDTHGHWQWLTETVQSSKAVQSTSGK